MSHGLRAVAVQTTVQVSTASCPGPVQVCNLGMGHVYDPSDDERMSYSRVSANWISWISKLLQRYCMRRSRLPP
jgi:hypothetical protein